MHPGTDLRFCRAAAVPEPARVAPGLDDVSVVGQPVERRRGDPGVE